VPAVKFVVDGLVVIVPVPPDVVSVALLVPPLHKIGVCKLVMFTWLGCAKVIVLVLVQPLASVAVNVYVPIDKFVLAGLVVMVPVPPPVVSVAVVVPPKHKIGLAAVLIVTGVGSVMVMLTVLLQPYASVPVNVYVPAVKPVVLGLVLIKPDPPVVRVTLLVPPLHKIGLAVADIVIGLGCVVVTVTLVVFVQPLASVAVNVYVPAVRFVLAGAVVMAPVPPFVVKVTLLVPPLHAIGVATAVMVSELGWVIVIVFVFEHPFASVAV
jgi:hypothetical protein